MAKTVHPKTETRTGDDADLDDYFDRFKALTEGLPRLMVAAMVDGFTAIAAAMKAGKEGDELTEAFRSAFDAHPYIIANGLEYAGEAYRLIITANKERKAHV